MGHYASEMEGVGAGASSSYGFDGKPMDRKGRMSDEIESLEADLSGLEQAIVRAFNETAHMRTEFAEPTGDDKAEKPGPLLSDNTMRITRARARIAVATAAIHRLTHQLDL